MNKLLLLLLLKPPLIFLLVQIWSSLKVILCWLQWGPLNIGTDILEFQNRLFHVLRGKPCSCWHFIIVFAPVFVTLVVSPIFTSSVAISFVLCWHFKAILLVGILPWHCFSSPFFFSFLFLAFFSTSDLPTPITCKSGGFEKKSRKTWRLGPQTWRFQNMRQIKKKNRLFVWVFFFYLFSAPCCILLLLFSLASSGQRLAILKFVHVFEG